MPALLELYDAHGGRKYLCARELSRFLAAAAQSDESTRLLCSLIAYSGCRVSEALALTADRLDADTGRVVFRSLKRRKLAFRAVPIPRELLLALKAHTAATQGDGRVWPWCRQTAWRRIKKVMDAAGVTGSQAMPKGLRHGFGVANAEENVPMATTQRWLGHAKLETTAIYQQAVGREETAFARRLWRKWDS